MGRNETRHDGMGAIAMVTHFPADIPARLLRAVRTGLLLLTALASSIAAANGGGELRLMIVSDIDCGCTSADIYGPMQASLDAFAERTGTRVTVTRAPAAGFEDAFETAVLGERPPDVVWTRPTEVAALVRDERIVPLGGLADEIGETLEDTPGWAMEQFVVNYQLYGIPLGREGELLNHGYAVTVAAARRGAMEISRDLIGHLKRTTPLRGMPDIAVHSLVIESEEEGVPREGVPLRLAADIRNLGEQSAESIVVSVEIDERQTVSRQEIEKLAPRQSYEVIFVIDPLPPGRHLIKLVADGANLVAESNEDNNFAIGKYAAGLSGPPAAPAALGKPFCLDAKAYRTGVWGMGPKVAFDGHNYLVVWAHQQGLSGTSYNHELRAARVSPAGTILDPGGFLVAAGPKKYNAFNLAYGAGRFMVVWEEDTAYTTPTAIPRRVIRGALVSPQGKIIFNAPFDVDIDTHPQAKGWNPVSHVEPDVYYTGSEFAVVYRTEISGTDQVDKWIAEKAGIYVRRVSIQGKVQPGKPNVIPFAQTLIGLGLQRAAFAKDRAALIHDGYHPGTKAGGVYNSWITMPSGVPQSTFPGILANNKNLHLFENPAVAANWPTFLAVWETSVGKPQMRRPDIHGAIGTASGPSGGSFATPIPLVKGQIETWPAVEYDGANFTLAYNHAVGCLNYVAAMRVTPTGVAGASVHFDSGWSLVRSVDIAFGKANGLIVFEKFNKPSVPNGSDFSTGICARFIDK
jgi:CARDB